MPVTSSILSRLVWFGRAARLALEDPVEGLDRALLRIARRRGAGDRETGAPDEAWERHLHALLGVPWPCEAYAEFEDVFSDVESRLSAQGLDVGRGAFGGWDDADPAFGRAVWCLTVHLRPQTVVETGVARGITTRLILEALEREKAGHLWSIDRAPLDRRLHPEIGAAVPAHLRSRWTFVPGTSRRVLPGLLDRIAPIDLFVHDSLHTERNLRFELTRALEAMGGVGALAADDVEQNAAFERFVEERPVLEALVALAEDGMSCFGIAVPRPGTGRDSYSSE
jgi:hypothetical protein